MSYDKRTALVVDDEPANLEMLRKGLRAAALTTGWARLFGSPKILEERPAS